MNKECVGCGKLFNGAKQAKYCSDLCRKKMSRGTPTVGTTNVGTTSTKKTKAKKADDDTLAKIYRELKLGTPPTDADREVTWVSSGVEEIDELVRSSNTSAYPGGGFPRNRITEIYGAKGVGKSTLMSTMVPKVAGRVLYFDVENALVTAPADNVTIVNETILEIVEPIVAKAVESGEYDVVVIDSVAALNCMTAADGDVADANMGLKARLMHSWLRRLNNSLRNSNTAVVFVNQERISMGLFATKYTPGGTALPYAASLRMELTSYSKDRIKKDKQQIGHWINVKLEKNRFGPTYTTTRFKAMYDYPRPIDVDDDNSKLDQAGRDIIEMKRREDNNITPEF